MNTEELYAQYQSRLRKIADIKYASAVLQWDQETYLPPKGSAMRGQQIATLAELAHDQFTDKRTGALLEELAGKGDLSAAKKRNVELSLEDYNKNKKLPGAFVRKLSEAVNLSYHAWIRARRENSFQLFQEPLSGIIDLKKQEADLLGYEDHPYDALMNDYDKGLTVEITDGLFEGLKPGLLNLYNRVKKMPKPRTAFLQQHFDKQRQWDFGLKVLTQMGYDFEAGRQDISEHPFTTNFSSQDVRVTTRVDEYDLGNMLWSCIHEGGHALYEQGLPEAEYGLPLGEYCSLSIHESQSRLWENCIGRGEAFWKFNYPSLQKLFPGALGSISLQDFYWGINTVQPSLIRTEADELSYHFHVMIRYEIEKELIAGSISAKDIPGLWKELYKNYLDIEVPDDRFGCLQDVHWSHGSFGYFATYSIGSLYAAQMYAKMEAENPLLQQEISAGNNSSVNSWLKQHIYKYGRYYNSNGLCKLATGEVLQSDAFIEYANTKYGAIYDLTKETF